MRDLTNKPFALGPAFGTMRSPDARPILEIHRGRDGYVIFARTEEGWKEWGERVENLQSIFPQFAAQLLEDSYFSINSFWSPRRGNKGARWLNAAYVDVDCKNGDELGVRLGMCFTAAHEGEIPKPSYVVFSGRGFWLLWLLVGADSMPPMAVWHNRVFYDEIERELVARCQADPKAKDIARVMRVPGSRNSKAGGAYVRFERLVGQDEQGHVYAYTLEQMGELLGVARPQMRPVKSGKRNPNFRGHVALWQQRYIAFNQLRQIRGGAFKEGCRNNACYLHAVMLWRMGMEKADIERDVFAFARQCRPPVSELDLRSTVQSACAIHTRTRFREETIMQWLAVTPEERAQIPRWNEASTIPARPCSASERDEIIASVTCELGFTPSLRTMQRQLAQRGVKACPETIRRAYLRLNAEFALRLPAELEDQQLRVDTHRK